MTKMDFLSLDDQENFDDFCNCNEGNIVFFVGAGVSHSEPSKMPLWNAVYDKLLFKAKKLYPSCRNQIDIIENLKNLDDTQSFLNAFEKLKELLGNNVYITTIRKEFKNNENLYPEILNTLLTRDIMGIITTNIDCLIETAHNNLVSQGKLHNQMQLISTFDYAAASEILHHKDWLWKIHGTLDNPDTWIFTLSEYFEKQFTTNYVESLINVFHNTRVVFIGYSAKDIDLLFMLEKLNKRFSLPLNGHLLLTRDCTDFDLAMLAEYGIDVIAYGGDENHSNLNKMLQKFPQKKKQMKLKKY